MNKDEAIQEAEAGDYMECPICLSNYRERSSILLLTIRRAEILRCIRTRYEADG